MFRLSCSTFFFFKFIILLLWCVSESENESESGGGGGGIVLYLGDDWDLPTVLTGNLSRDLELCGIGNILRAGVDRGNL